MTLTCGRCGEGYRADRETAIEHGNGARCPACGKENEPAQSPTVPNRVGLADGGETDVVSSVVDQLETDGKEVHLHFHFHR